MTPRLPQLTLVLGGARSGKSRYAEGLVTGLPPPWTYIATAEAYDAEMRQRIGEHVARRGPGWRTIETPRALAETIRAENGKPAPILVDCLTLWLSNLILDTTPWAPAADALLNAIDEGAAPVVLISNEVGQGIVPDNALARAFRDAQGLLNQRIAARAERVVLVAAGLPLTLKDITPKDRP